MISPAASGAQDIIGGLVSAAAPVSDDAAAQFSAVLGLATASVTDATAGKGATVVGDLPVTEATVNTPVTTGASTTGAATTEAAASDVVTTTATTVASLDIVPPVAISNHVPVMPTVVAPAVPTAAVPATAVDTTSPATPAPAAETVPAAIPVLIVTTAPVTTPATAVETMITDDEPMPTAPSTTADQSAASDATPPVATAPALPSCDVEMPAKIKPANAKPVPVAPETVPVPPVAVAQAAPKATAAPKAPAVDGEKPRDDRPRTEESKGEAPAPSALAAMAAAIVPPPVPNSPSLPVATDPTPVRKGPAKAAIGAVSDRADAPSAALLDRAGPAIQQSAEVQKAVAAAVSSDSAAAPQPAKRDDAAPLFPGLTPIAEAHPHRGAQAGSQPQDMSQQVASTLIGGHNHQQDFAARMETLANQVFVHGRSQNEARFTVEATELGPVAVEVARQADGVAVSFQTNNEVARTAIADAQPRLAADARMAGITLSQSRVDTGAGQGRRGGGNRQDQNRSVSGVVAARSLTTHTEIQSASDRFA